MDLMLDIETLDTRASSVVLSVALVPFDPVLNLVKDESLHLRLDVDQQLAYGRTVSFSTIQFWVDDERTDARARSAAFGTHVPRLSMSDAFGEMSAFVGRNGAPDRDLRVWSKGPSFDGAVLDSLHDTMALFSRKNGLGAPRRPWHFRAHRDVRTVLDLAGVEPNWHLPTWRPVFDLAGVEPNWHLPTWRPDAIPHDPVDDCLWQIMQVCEAYRRLGLRRAVVGIQSEVQD